MIIAQQITQPKFYKSLSSHLTVNQERHAGHMYTGVFISICDFIHSPEEYLEKLVLNVPEASLYGPPNIIRQRREALRKFLGWSINLREMGSWNIGGVLENEEDNRESERGSKNGGMELQEYELERSKRSRKKRRRRTNTAKEHWSSYLAV